MLTRIAKYIKSRQGVSLVLFTAGFLVFLLIAGMVIDYSVKYAARQELHKYTDASSLAGAQALGDTSAARSNAAYAYALNLNPTTPPARNSAGSFALGAGGSYTIGGDAVSVETPFTKTGYTPSELIHVSACRTVNLYFAQLAGVRRITVCAQATARKRDRNIGMLVLTNGADAGALTIGGTTALTVNNGAVIVNSSASGNKCALDVSASSSSITANQIDVTGCASTGSATITGTLSTNVPPAIDPLANLAAPSTNGYSYYDPGNITASVSTQHPGIYLNQVSFKNTVYFEPGIYFFYGGVKLTGGPRLSVLNSPADTSGSLASQRTGTGVMFYNAGTSSFDMAGGATIDLNPPTSGTYSNISFFQARDNNQEVKITGQGASDFGGIYYTPNAKLTLGGGVNNTIGTIIANETKITGDSFTISPQIAIGGGILELVD